MTVLTIDAILRAKATIDAMPKLPQLFSYSLWPDGDATFIAHEDGPRVLANPAMWERFEASTQVMTVDQCLTLTGLAVINLDLPANKELRQSLMIDLMRRLTTCDTDPENESPAANDPEAGR